VFYADEVTGVGTFPIKERHPDSNRVSWFLYTGPAHDYPDSLQLYASSPPSWWHGGAVLPTGGEVKITRLDRGPYYSTMAGTFTFIGNSYYSRIEDSTYMIDTVTYTDQVTKYYYQQKEVKGSFSGLVGFR
jgi:hypothetical protein